MLITTLDSYGKPERVTNYASTRTSKSQYIKNLNGLCYNEIMVKYTANGCPSEDDEEHVLSDYCDVRGWRHTHFSNETYTTSWKQKNKMKYLGVHSGVPDHLVLVPNKSGRFYTVYVEMKRQKGGTISDSQFEWIMDLLTAGQYVAVCEGGSEAVEYVEAVYSQNEKKIQEYNEKFLKKYENWLKKKKKQKNDCPF